MLIEITPGTPLRGDWSTPQRTKQGWEIIYSEKLEGLAFVRCIVRDLLDVACQEWLPINDDKIKEKFLNANTRSFVRHYRKYWRDG